MESLFGSLPEMLDFQKVFLQTLEDGISSAVDFNVLETPSQFRVSIIFVTGLQEVILFCDIICNPVTVYYFYF